MLPIPRPSISAVTSYVACLRGVSDIDTRNRLKDLRREIVEAERDYEGSASSGALNVVSQTGDVKDVIASELVNLYDSRFARQGSPGRRLYESLIAAAPNGKCPLCAHRSVSTLDHFLPKSKFSLLTVTPMNLIPACRECNVVKHAEVSTFAEEVPMHPYFDNTEEIDWLIGHVIEVEPTVVVFSVDGANWPSDLLRSRVRNHFVQFKLGALYSAQAAEEMSNIHFSLVQLHNAGGRTSVREHLLREAESRRRVRRNSWQSTLYAALATNDWYCNGGFKLSR